MYLFEDRFGVDLMATVSLSGVVGGRSREEWGSGSLKGESGALVCVAGEGSGVRDSLSGSSGRRGVDVQQ